MKNPIKTELMLLLAGLMLGYLTGTFGIAPADGEEAKPAGAIYGNVVYKTGEEKPLPGQKVILHIFDKNNLVDRMETNADDSGEYRFENVPVNESYTYMVAAFYKDVLYLSDHVLPKEGQAEAASDIAVYDVTTDDAALSVEKESLLMSVEDNVLQVHELLILSNDGDRSVVPEQLEGEISGETAKFTFPAGFFDLQKPSGSMGGAFAEIKEGLVTNVPLIPGQSQFAFSYKLRADKDEFSLRKTLDYPVKEFQLLISDVGIKVESSELENQGTVNMGNGRFIKLAGKNLEKGRRLNISLENLNPTGTRSTTKWLSVIFAAALVAVSYLYPRGRGGNRSSEPQKEEGGPAVPAWLVNYSAHPEGRRLVEEIAALDKEFESGAKEMPQYRTEREEKKRKLISLLTGGKGSKT